MSETNKGAVHMSDADAKAEHDDIQREIAKSKGLDYDPKTGEMNEPVEPTAPTDPNPTPDKTPVKPDGDKGETVVEPDTAPADIDPDADPGEKPRRPSLVDRYREVKTEKEDALEELGEAKKTIETLTAELNKTKTVEQLKDKVKVYAEKHGMAEEAAMDMVLLLKDSIQPDPTVRSVIEESKALIQNQKAQTAFEEDFSNLLTEIPEAAEAKDKIRSAAFKPENLTKSLYELFHRLNTVAPVRRKTGEPQRGAPAHGKAPDTFDLKAVAEKVKSGAAGSMDGLSGEQQDQVFAYLEKQGSRYSR